MVVLKRASKPLVEHYSSFSMDDYGLDYINGFQAGFECHIKTLFICSLNSVIVQPGREREAYTSFETSELNVFFFFIYNLFPTCSAEKQVCQL